MGEHDKNRRYVGGWSMKDLAISRAKTRARWLASLRNGRKRYSRPH